MRYMIIFTFIPGHEAEVAALLPKEQEYVKTLAEKGIVEAIYIGNEGERRVWGVWKGESKEEIQKLVETLPLHPYMHTEIVNIA